MYARVISDCSACEMLLLSFYFILEMSYLAPSHEYAYLRSENDQRAAILLAKVLKFRHA